MSSQVFSTGYMNYVKVVRHEAVSPCCEFTSGIRQVKYALNGRTVGSNRKIPVFQVRAERNDSSIYGETFSVGGFLALCHI